MKKYLKYYVALVLLITGLMGFKMIFSPSAGAASESSSACDETVSAARAMQAGVKPGATWSERNTPGYQRDWLALHNIIIGQADCFTPATVAKAQADMQAYLGH